MIRNEDKRKAYDAINACSKSEIIEWIVNEKKIEYNDIERLIDFACDRRVDKLQIDEDKAFDAYSEASKRYTNWVRDMTVRHGDGKTYRIKDIPEEELNDGITLLRKSESTYNEYKMKREITDKARRDVHGK